MLNIHLVERNVRITVPRSDMTAVTINLIEVKYVVVWVLHHQQFFMGDLIGVFER